MDTVELTIPASEPRHEVLIARLEEFGFSGFQTEADQLKAYIPADEWSDGKSQFVASWLQKQGVDGELSERVIEAKNWNEAWEQSVRPVRAGPFWIKPTWAEAPAEADPGDILAIDPKMSFGTGYHESTRLVLRLLPEHVDDGARVLDAGTGTGVLAIAAVRLGAQSVIAFDTDRWAEENATENVALNEVAGRVDVRRGTIDVVPETGFDCILANIERDVLIDLLPACAEKINPGGSIILSGLLDTDRSAILEAAAEQNLHPVDEARENEWWCVVLSDEHSIQI